MSWTIRVSPQVKGWLRELAKADPKAAAATHAAVDELAYRGPALGRPLADSIRGSRHSNMKELRPRSGQKVSIRILFAFDPKRHCVLLFAGNKADDWTEWYEAAIDAADDEFDAWLATLEENDG